MRRGGQLLSDTDNKLGTAGRQQCVLEKNSFEDFIKMAGRKMRDLDSTYSISSAFLYKQLMMISRKPAAMKHSRQIKQG